MRAVDVERLQSAQIGWGFHQDSIAGIDEQFSDQVQRLL